MRRRILVLFAGCLLGGSALAADYVPVPAGELVSALAANGRAARVPMRAFAMRSEPVTVAEFADFLRDQPQWRRDAVSPLFADGHYLSAWQGPLTPGPGLSPRQPVTQVSWFAARAFCAGEHARLPDWYEWEYVAAADATRRDARGDARRNQAILGDILASSGRVPGDIGTRPANVYGVRDLNRLLWEWTGDYAAMFPNPDAREPGEAPLLALCGGSALAFADKNQYALIMRVAALAALRPAESASRVGFRCVRDHQGDAP